MKQYIRRYIFYFLGLLILHAVFTVHAASLSDDQVVWDRQPIEVILPVGHERLVSFPTPIKLGYDIEKLPPSLLHVQNNQGTLYLTAEKIFARQRVQVQLTNGKVILLDLVGQAVDKMFPLTVLLSTAHQKISTTAAPNIPYVALMRYAIKQLYGSWHALNPISGIRRFPMHTHHVVSLFYDQSVIAMPLASWRGGAYYITALSLKNRLLQRRYLHAGDLCGDWKAASFYPTKSLSPRGQWMKNDRTNLFLISSMPFSDAIRDCA